MNIKIVTDSTADLSPQLARGLGITVVPAYVCFGNKRYRDQTEITNEEFYKKLLTEADYPTTMPPTPPDFFQVYNMLSSEADGILSIHISGRLSATVNAALRGKELIQGRCPIEVIDSQLATMGVGLLAIAAKEHAASVSSLKQLAAEVRDMIPRITVVGYLDTLKYLAIGGRIGKAKAWLGSLFNVKPILTMKEGELEPLRQVRSRLNGMVTLADCVRNIGEIEDSAVVYSTTLDDARMLAEDIQGTCQHPVRLAQLGPVLGVHSGPGILFIALRAK